MLVLFFLFSSAFQKDSSQSTSSLTFLSCARYYRCIQCRRIYICLSFTEEAKEYNIVMCAHLIHYNYPSQRYMYLKLSIISTFFIHIYMHTACWSYSLRFSVFFYFSHFTQYIRVCSLRAFIYPRAITLVFVKISLFWHGSSLTLWWTSRRGRSKELFFFFLFFPSSYFFSRIIKQP